MNSPPRALLGSAPGRRLAGLTAYQAVLLTPILAVYLFERRRTWYPAWTVVLAAPAAIAVWQLWEWTTRGALPAAVLLGYMRSYSFHKTSNTLRSMAALVVHSGWIVSPLLVIAAFWPKQRLAAFCSGSCDANCRDIRREPIVLALGRMRRPSSHLSGHRGPAPRLPGRLGRHLLRRGAADLLRRVRALPVADRSARSRFWRRAVAAPRWLAAGFALQLILSLGLATANYQHWDGYRQFAKTLAPDAAQHRVWVDAEWGLRYYLESEGALPLARDQAVQPGDTIVSSELAQPVTVNAPVAQVQRSRHRPQHSAASDLAEPPFGLFERGRAACCPSRSRARPRIVCAPISSSTGNPC